MKMLRDPMRITNTAVCVPINEFVTVCRCPVCKDKRRQPESKKRKRTTLQRCESEDMVSESTKDGRIEKCSKCGNEWGHDKISMLNMCLAKDALR